MNSKFLLPACLAAALIAGCSKDPASPGPRPPDIPSSPAPGDNSAGNPLNADLTWHATDPDGDTLTYQLYFGAENPPPLYRSDLGSPAFDLPGLNWDTQYFWKVISIQDSLNHAESPLWNFRTLVAASGEPQPGTERWFPLGNSGDSLLMCWIPSGSFMMGTSVSGHEYKKEKPVHLVTFAHGFWMAKFEMTQRHWIAVMHSNPPEHPAGSTGFDVRMIGPEYPEFLLSWTLAKTILDSVDTAFSLPSEAEWEYAYRAGTETLFYWGDDTAHTEINDYAWYAFNSDSVQHVVGQKLPNAWNLYDMAGNVGELCEDIFTDSYSDSINGDAPSDGSAWYPEPGVARVGRGGDFVQEPQNCRAAHRRQHIPNAEWSALGFRLVRRAD